MTHSHPDNTASAAVHWEDRYVGSQRVWSGKPNPTMTAVAGDLDFQRALDLGCGEGADAIWLAQQGAVVTGVDISPTAIRRATEAARNLGLTAEQANFIAADLAEWDDPQTYDLVTASFLQSPVDLPRTQVLRRITRRINVGGHLLVVWHAAMPPWASGAHHDHQFVSPAEEVSELDLDSDWKVELAEVRSRPAVGPDGQEALLDDGVVLIQRTA